jgi:hypothetical protein
MDKKVKARFATWGIIILIVFIVFLIVYDFNKSEGTTKEIAKCIGENSLLYTQLGCHACEIQEKMFGENYKYLEIVDCFYEREKCVGIEATPTWKIKEKLYRGVQSIEDLQELTGC